MAGASEPVAILGIGAMGHGIALSALRAGIPTVVWDRRPRDRFAQAHVHERHDVLHPHARERTASSPEVY